MTAHRSAVLIVLLAAVSPVTAQPLSLIDPGRELSETWQVGTIFTTYRSNVYVDRNHTTQHLPSPLNIGERSVHLSRRFGDRWSGGVEIPLRSASFGPQKMRAFSGGSVFVQTHAYLPRVDALLRASYFHMSKPKTSFVIPDSPQIELLAAASTRDGVLPGSARAIANWSGRYAKADGVTPRFAASTFSFAASPAELGTRSLRIRPSALAGFTMRTSGRHGGIHFANRTSRGAFGGIRIDIEPKKTSAHAVTLEATRDFAVANGPSGWQLAIGVRRAF